MRMMSASIQPDRGADGERDDARGDAHAQADAQAVEDRAPHVAPRAVGAEPHQEARRAALARREPRVHHRHRRQVVGVLRREPGGEHCEKNDECEREERSGSNAAGEEFRYQALEGRLRLLDDRQRLGRRAHAFISLNLTLGSRAA
jgi:hypothetical protein